MNEEVKYYSNELWGSSDKSVSGNYVTLSMFMKRDDYGLSQPGLNLTICNPTAKSKKNIVVNHSMVCSLITAFDKLMGEIVEVTKKFKEDPKFQKVVKSQNDKHKVSITYMYNSGVQSPKFRFAISEVDDKDLDNAMICWANVADVVSMMTVLSEYKSDYVKLTMSMGNNFLAQENFELLTHINHKMSVYYARLKSDQSNKDNGEQPEEIIQKDEYEKDIEEQRTKNVPAEVPDIATDDIHNEMGKYIDENKDTIQADGLVGLPTKQSDAAKAPAPEKKIVKLSEGSFTEKVIDGSSYQLETILFSMKSIENPFDKICSLIQDKLNISREELLPSCSEDDYKSLCYLISRQVNHTLHMHINNGMALSNSVIPICYDSTECKPLNRDLLYDIMLYFVLYNQLHTQCKDRNENTIHNKGLISFTMKVLLSPFIFSFLKHVESKEILVKEVMDRFENYRSNEVFNETYEKLKHHFGTDVIASATQIEKMIGAVYDSTIDKLDKFQIRERWEYMLTKVKSLVTPIDLIRKPDVNLEQINSILRLEILRKNRQKVILSETRYTEKDFKDIRPDIAKCFGLQLGPNITNLKKLAEDVIEDEELKLQALEIVSKVGNSYHDLKGENIDFTPYPDKFLVGLALWDTDDDSRLKRDYNYLLTKISESEMDHGIALSILSDIEDKVEEDYSSSLELTN